MKHHKKFDQAIKLATEASFTNNRLDNVKVKRFTKSFLALPKSGALYCLRNYLRRLRTKINLHTLLIESTSRLTDSQVAALKTDFQARYPITDVESKINPTLLAGLRVKIGDTIFEDSVNDKIIQLKRAITA